MSNLEPKDDWHADWSRQGIEPPTFIGDLLYLLSHSHPKQQHRNCELFNTKNFHDNGSSVTLCVSDKSCDGVEATV